MSYNYDPRTGRRIYTTEHKLADAEYYLTGLQREAAEAKAVLEMTPVQRFRASVITSVIAASGVATGIIFWVGTTDPDVAGGVGFGTIVSGLVLLFAVITVFERIGDVRGGGAQALVSAMSGVAKGEKRVEELTDQVRSERARERAKLQRKQAEPSPEELMAAVISTASRTAALTDADAALWAVAAADPENAEAWSAIGSANGWSPELTTKVRAAGAHNRAPVAPPARRRVRYHIERPPAAVTGPITE